MPFARSSSPFGREISLLHAGWLSVLAGLGLSLLGVYAIDLGAQDQAPRSLAELSPLATRQLVYLVAGLLAAAIVALPNSRTIRLLAWPALGASIILLILLLLPFMPTWLVTPRNGVRGWINLGPVDLQPAEFAKIAFILAAADYLRYRKNHRTIPGLIPPALITFVPIGLIVLQPDLGMALLFLPAIFAMLIAAGARLKHMIMVVVIGALAAPAAYPFLHEYQKQRIIGLIAQFKGERHTSDDLNYQAYTAQTIAGAGQVDGYGDLKSRAVIRYNALPERHNDMIFSVVVNRFGLFGGLGVMALYAVWIIGALITCALTKDPFGRLAIVGCVGVMAAQVTINIGMVIGLLPIVGLTLPFVSYGGSSMAAVWLMTGLIVSVAMRKPARLVRPTFEFDD